MPEPVSTLNSAANAQRVLVIAPHSSYRTAAYIQAAQLLNTEVLIASEGEHSIVSEYARGLHINFTDSEAAFQTIIESANEKSFAGVIGTDDSCLELASRVAKYFNLPHNPPASVRIAGRKDLSRECLKQAQVAIPQFRKIDLNSDIETQIEGIEFPVVIKPVALSGSRGVIRANDQQALLSAIARVQKLLSV